MAAQFAAKNQPQIAAAKKSRPLGVVAAVLRSKRVADSDLIYISIEMPDCEPPIVDPPVIRGRVC
jgi:hypothetical protein